MTIPGLNAGEKEKRPRNAAGTVVEPSVTAAQAEALATTAALVTAIITDHASEEAAHLAAEQESRAIESLEAGRRRRDNAELDDAHTTGHDITETAAEPFHEPAQEPGIDLWADQ